MILEHLSLCNYRNYRGLDLDLSPGLNLVCGNNAQGKTNLLEAIYYLGTLKSFRVRSEAELASWGENSAGIEASFRSSDSRRCKLEIRWAKDGQRRWERRIKRNGVAVTNLADILSEVPLVLFIPQDLALVQGSPEMRRRYLDILLCKTSKAYFYALVRYQQIVRQRNGWWHRGDFRRWSELEVWDEQFALLAAQIVAQRQMAINRLSELVSRVFSDLAEEPLSLRMEYRSSVGSDSESIRRSLIDKRSEEMIRRVTLLGPHRDDVALSMGGRAFKLCASQGQHRSAALALRLAEATFMGESSGEKAIILLDDCFSELDKGRCQRLFDYLGAMGQVVVTSVVPLEYNGATTVVEYAVHNGDVTRQEPSRSIMVGTGTEGQE